MGRERRLSLVVPILVAAPAYFGGALTLGGLIMVAGAFTQVQGAMRWFVDNFSRLADWRAAVHRVARFREALDNFAIARGRSVCGLGNARPATFMVSVWLTFCCYARLLSALPERSVRLGRRCLDASP